MKTLKKKASDKPARRKAPLSAKGQFDPNVHAGVLAFTFQPAKTDTPITLFYNELQRLSSLSDKAKLRNIETMLMGQALALQSMATWFALKAENTMLIDHLDTFAHLALKAQRQCRATLATLAEIKSPRHATFIKNRAGYQQVNFGRVPVSRKNSQQTSNELLRSQPDATLDSGRAAYPVAINSPVETVVPINRAKDTAGCDASKPERTKARAIQR